MLFSILKFPARLAFLIYCRQLRITHKAMLRLDGPLLIAANHPNSFFDAIVLATLFRRPVYSLARGDAFAGPVISRLLRWLNIMPVYRLSEGAENLGQNYDTFDTCRDIFKRNGIVLIFSEGRCINEWHLRPLMKGTGRLAISSWEAGIPLKVLPLGLNYSSFRRMGKNIHLNLGQLITGKDLAEESVPGKKLRLFNTLLTTQLQQLVYEIDKTDLATRQQLLGVPVHPVKKILLAVPALIGAAVHLPLYWPLQTISWKYTAHIDHYDSVMTGALFLLYPLYLLGIALTAVLLTGNCWWWLLVVALPFCAWACVQVKKQF